MTAPAGLLPDAPTLALFAGAVAVLNATPGADFLLTVSRTLGGGARAGVATVAGITAGCAVHALAAAFGLAALLAVHPQALLAIQWAGAAYLAVLGMQMLAQALRPRAAAGVSAAAAARPWRADFRVGLLTNVLNPKVALFFLAFIPQFVPTGSPAPTLSFLLLGGWFVLQGGAFSLALVALAARLSRAGASAPLRRLLQAAGGLLFLALAVRLLKARPLAA